MNMYLSNKGMSLNPHKLMDNSEQRTDFKRLPKNVDFFSSVNFDQLYIFLVENFFSQPTPPPQKKKITKSIIPCTQKSPQFQLLVR